MSKNNTLINEPAKSRSRVESTDTQHIISIRINKNIFQLLSGPSTFYPSAFILNNSLRKILQDPSVIKKKKLTAANSQPL